MSVKACKPIQFIDGKGLLDEYDLTNFVNQVTRSKRCLSYAVVSIMGPQGSGKSTLLNHLFHTQFKEMNANEGRNQTTQGIWLSQAHGIEPCTLVMDLEGTDGSERGEDDTKFERQTALFALAVSDIVLINIWCHDIGREHAANKPLLRTVFWVMMRLKLFGQRKTLLFVIRDKSKTPVHLLEQKLLVDIHKIWDSVLKSEKRKETPLDDVFKVEVEALSSYEDKENEFKQQVSVLRRRLTAPDRLGGDMKEDLSGFTLKIKEIWKTIRDNKDLDLPTVKTWQELDAAVRSGPVEGFGQRLSSILNEHFSSYDKEVQGYEESVRTSKRQKLVSDSLSLVYPAYKAMLAHLAI